MAWKDHVPRWMLRAARPVYPLYRAMQLWNEAGGMRMSAAMSFYGILSLAPLLLLMVAMLGWWLDREMLESSLINQVAGVVGKEGGDLVKGALASAQEPSEGIAASIVGFGVLLFGATGVFTELQGALERLWAQGRGPQPRPVWWHAATLRLRGLAYVLVFGFLLLVSLVVSTLLTMFSGWASQGLVVETALRIVNEAAAFAVSVVLFAGLMRLSSGPKPPLRFLVVGGFASAILFTLGRQLLAAYLSTAAVVSAYGAAGSLIVLLMWIYFSSAVLLLGAGCARALEELQAARHATGTAQPSPQEQRAALGTPQGQG